MGLTAQMFCVYVLILVLTDFTLSTEPITGSAAQKRNQQYEQSEGFRRGTKMANMQQPLNILPFRVGSRPKYRCPSKTFPASPVDFWHQEMQPFKFLELASPQQHLPDLLDLRLSPPDLSSNCV